MRWMVPIALLALLDACVDLSRDVVLAPDAEAPEVDLGFDATPPPVDAAPVFVEAGPPDAIADATPADARAADLGRDAARAADAEPDAAVDAEPDAAADAEPDQAPPCEPSPEVCNALDDDCDGVVDEALPWVGQGCSALFGDCRIRGHSACHRAGERVCLPEPADTLAERAGAIRGCNCDVDHDVPERPYLLCAGDATWADASAICAAVETRLVVLDSGAEVVELTRLLRRRGRTNWWIGLSDQAEEGEFVWGDGRPHDPEVVAWQAGEPNDFAPGGEDCVVLDAIDRDLNDEACEDQRAFVCEPFETP